MARILVIDDEPVYHKMVTHALSPLDYEVKTAFNGAEGVKLAQVFLPDLIISDVMMPELSGYEVTRRLRRDSQFAHTPILILTSQAEIQDKLKSFEAGADDHMTKPFDQAELVARVGVLLRHSEVARKAQELIKPRQEEARLIAIHSLRGGVGCSSMAVNLAWGLAGLWEGPTLLLDLVLMAGQVALMLNTALKRTWADLAHFKPEELDIDIIQSIITDAGGGLQIIAAPTHPTEAEKLQVELLAAALKSMRLHYDYMIADLPHDFSDIAIQTLDLADLILVPLAPELSSVRAAAAALETYHELGYSEDKIKLLLNSTFPRGGLQREKIEAALNKPVSVGVPYTPDKFVEAINLGKPLLAAQPNEPISALIEDFAFYLSKEQHKKTRPITPSTAWKRVYKRFSERRK
jgi:pilus assembly protein CpaE